MDIFRSRYLFMTCMLAVAVSVISFFVLPIVKLIIAMSAIVISMAAMLLYIFRRSLKGYVIFAIMLCMATFLSSFSSFMAFDASFTAERAIIGDTVKIQALIVGEEYNSGNMSGYSVIVEDVEGERKGYRAILECSYISEVHIGDRIVATVKATDFENNIHGYSEKLSRLADGYYMSFESASEDEYEIIEEDVKDLRVAFKSLNTALCYKLRSAIGGEEGNLSAAMLLGNKGYLSDTTFRDYSRSGASHFLALSGLHMVIVMGCIAFILKLIRVPKTPRAIFLIVAALGYLVLTGVSVSATRAVIMLLWVYLSMIFSYRSDTLTNLSFAGAAILIFSPFAVIDAAFWMSFAATFGIVVFMQIFTDIFDRIESESKIIRLLKKAAVYVLGLFATTICAFLGLVLVICIFTKQYSLYTIVASVVLSLPSTVIILFSLLLPVFSFCPPIRSLLVDGIRRCGAFSLDVCADISNKENIVYSLNYDFLVYFAVAFAIVLVISLVIKLKHKHLVLFMYAPIIAAFILTVSIVNTNEASKVDITYYNTSSRSDIIVVANDRNAIICDLSNGSRDAFSYALDAVDNSRASEITAIMLTDYHTAHIPTLSNIFKSRMVRQLWLPTPSDEDSYYRMLSILDVANENNVRVRMYDTGDNLYAFGEVRITLEQSYIERSTVPISVMSIECGDDTLTYFSPSYVECERRSEFEGIISESDYLIVGARGPKQKNYFTVGENSEAKEILICDTAIGIYLDTAGVDAPILLNAKIKTYSLYRNDID